MTTVEIPVGTTRAPAVRFVREGVRPDGGAVKLGQVEVDVAVRGWDVTDPEARREAATQELGEIEERHRTEAMWFIDAGRNAAALCVFRATKEQVT